MKKQSPSVSSQSKQLQPTSSNSEEVNENYEEISRADISKLAEGRTEKQMVDNIIYHSC